MNTEDFSARIEALVGDAREEGLSDEEMLAQLEDSAAALREGLFLIDLS